MKRSLVYILALVVVIVSAAVSAIERSPAPASARVYFIWPKDGQVIRGGKFWARFGLRNAGIAPAGVVHPNTGHHHLIVDADLPPFDEEIPADKHYLHFGAGQSEARLNLPPGEHTLQLIMGDHNHVPHDPPVYSTKITIIVP